MEPVKSRARKVVGWSLIILGLVGLLLPILQGILLIGAGLAIVENQVISQMIEDLKKKAKRLNRSRKARKAKKAKKTK